MSGTKKYSAYVVSGLFLFPLIFQSFHLLNHQTSTCESSHCCDFTEHKHEQEKEHQAGNASMAYTANNHEDCLICDYQFVLVKLSTGITQEIVAITFKETINKPDYTIENRDLFFPKSPRAPPTQIS